MYKASHGHGAYFAQSTSVQHGRLREAVLQRAERADRRRAGHLEVGSFARLP